MHLVFDGKIWENDSFSIVNKNLVTALHRLGYDVRLNAWGQGSDKLYKESFIDRDLLFDLAVREKDYEDAVVIRHSWPVCEPYYSEWCNWDNTPGKIRIGLLPWESDHVPKRWLAPMTNVDAIMAISPLSAERMELELRTHNVQTPVWAVSLGVDTRLFHPLAEPSPLVSGGRSFRFLFVGVGQMRKGSDLLRAAYFEEFTAADDVSLIVKTGGWDSIGSWVGNTHANSPHVMVIHDDNLSETDMGGLYTGCHCLVHPSRLEGFGMTMLEAMASGTLVICPERGAHRVFANEENALLVHGSDEKMDFFEDLVTTAYVVDITDLRRAMRYAVTFSHDASSGPRFKTRSALKTARQFSWEACVTNLIEKIESIFNVQLERQ